MKQWHATFNSDAPTVDAMQLPDAPIKSSNFSHRGDPSSNVALHSGFTFSRAAASRSNSKQTPKLPDWAIVDTSVPPDDAFPGKIVDAGFFDEQWKFTKDRPK